MFRKVLEPLVMGETLVRWLVLGTATGALVGAVVALFLKLLFWSISQTAHTHIWELFFLLPFGGLVTGILIHYGAPDAAGHGTEAVIRAVHRRSGAINWKVAPIKALATITTMAAGGSAGKEGPSAQIGSALASLMADVLKFAPDQRKKLVICGIGAGFAAVFGTPVAGAILGIEVLAIGSMMYEMLVPSFVSAVVAYVVARGVGLRWFYPHPHVVLTLTMVSFAKMVALGVASGLVAYAFVLIMDRIHHLHVRLSKSPRWWPPLSPALAGLALCLLTVVVGRSYLNLSLPLLNHALMGGHVAWYAWFWKLLFVAITLGFGMSGGIITPLFVIGASLGAAASGFLHIPIAAGAEVGLVAVTAAGANVPIAAIILGMEIFGPGLSPFFLAAAVPAYTIIGNHSVYPSQQLSLVKSAYLKMPLGGYLEDAPEVSLTYLARHRIVRMSRRFHLPKRSRRRRHGN